MINLMNGLSSILFSQWLTRFLWEACKMDMCVAASCPSAIPNKCYSEQVIFSCAQLRLNLSWYPNKNCTLCTQASSTTRKLDRPS